MEINYFSEDIEFSLTDKQATSEWIAKSAHNEGVQVDEISVIFCSDSYLLDMNRMHLNHDYYTDIITFNYNEEGEELVIAGDLFISVDRVKENAQEYSVTFEEELNRVIIHGVLHLVGYNDETDIERAEMRQKEDYYLGLKQK